MSSPFVAVLEDVQNTAAQRQIPIDKVGIKDVSHPAVVKDRSGGAERSGGTGRAEQRGRFGLAARTAHAAFAAGAEQQRIAQAGPWLCPGSATPGVLRVPHAGHCPAPTRARAARPHRECLARRDVYHARSERLRHPVTGPSEACAPARTPYRATPWHTYCYLQHVPEGARYLLGSPGYSDRSCRQSRGLKTMNPTCEPAMPTNNPRPTSQPLFPGTAH